MILVLLGESGSGKTTLQKYISDKVNMKPIVSVTTRPKRKGEKKEIWELFTYELIICISSF